MIKWSEFYRGMLAVWPMVIDFPRPAFLGKVGKKVSHSAMLGAFPFLGMSLGIVAALVGWLIMHTFNHVAGALFYAFVAMFLVDCKDSGRGLGLITSLFLFKLKGYSCEDALPHLKSDVTAPINNPAGVAFLTFLEILKFALFFILGLLDAKLWLMAILAGSFTLQGYLALLPDVASKTPFLTVSPDNHRLLWISASIVGVISLLFFPFATIVAGGFLYFFIRGVAHYFKNRFEGIAADWITLSASIAELGLLLIGILLALHPVH